MALMLSQKLDMTAMFLKNNGGLQGISGLFLLIDSSCDNYNWLGGCVRFLLRHESMAGDQAPRSGYFRVLDLQRQYFARSSIPTNRWLQARVYGA